MGNSYKKRDRRQNRQQQTSLEFQLKTISPLNPRQEQLLRSNRNLVLSGFAGTGKTFLSSYIAYSDVFDGKYDKIVYMRSAVPTRNIGFLPGNEKEKVEVYEAPYIDIATELLGRGDAYEILKKKSIIHFMSTSFIRGVTLRNAVIIVDETQNMTYHELDSLITRLGDNCRVIFCGDIRQSDLYKNGFEDFYKVIRSMNEFDFIEFEKEDIVRSELVKSYIIKKDEVLNRR
jgi:phosphate starvation-inducible PhoH-like protein